MGAVYTKRSVKGRIRAERSKLAKVPVRKMARVLRRSKAAKTRLELKLLCNQANNTPRKCPGWRGTAEVFREKMMQETGRHPYRRRE